MEDIIVPIIFFVVWFAIVFTSVRKSLKTKQPKIEEPKKTKYPEEDETIIAEKMLSELCPRCGNKIRVLLKKCPHCNYRLYD